MKPLVEHILRNASNFEWSLQGMGMLRLYLPDNCRLHIWDARFRFPGVSMIHDHLQWGLESTIVAGVLENIRYVEDPAGNGFRTRTLQPGEGYFWKDEAKDIRLSVCSHEQYTEGYTYFQKPYEIHRTEAQDGTVTFMRKQPTEDNSARVFWRQGEEWGSAEPRRATPEEVEAIVSNSLERWFK